MCYLIIGYLSFNIVNRAPWVEHALSYTTGYRPGLGIYSIVSVVPKWNVSWYIYLVSLNILNNIEHTLSGLNSNFEIEEDFHFISYDI